MANTYPITTFHFKVSGVGDDSMGFSDVSGLTQEIQVVEYRDGLMNARTPALKRPGFVKFPNITLKKGMTEGNKKLYEWFINSAGLPSIDRRDLTISLLNDEGDPVVVWTILQAWPVKIEGPALKATGNEIAIESVELAHEGTSILLS